LKGVPTPSREKDLTKGGKEHRESAKDKKKKGDRGKGNL